MARRALLWLLPILIALAFIVPMSGADSVPVTAFERSASDSTASTAHVPAPINGSTAFWNQQSVDDDDPDRLVNVGEMPIAWYRVAIFVPLCSESDVAPRARSVCTAFPRGPPSA